MYSVSKSLPMLIVLLAAPVFNLASITSARALPDGGSDGSSTTVDDLIESSNRDQLVSVTVNLDSAHTHRCGIVASAQTTQPSGDGGVFWFDLLDGTQVIAAANRQIAASTEKPLLETPVSTNITLSGLKGTHVFSFTALKYPGSANFTVTASAISVTCNQGTSI